MNCDASIFKLVSGYLATKVDAIPEPAIREAVAAFALPERVVQTFLPANANRPAVFEYLIHAYFAVKSRMPEFVELLLTKRVGADIDWQYIDGRVKDLIRLITPEEEETGTAEKKSADIEHKDRASQPAQKKKKSSIATMKHGLDDSKLATVPEGWSHSLDGAGSAIKLDDVDRAERDC